MSTVHNPIKLFETVVDDCPYLEDELSASILVDPDHEIDPQLFSLLSRSGFRRSGEILYAPKCPKCAACVSVRIPVEHFTPSRNQHRVLNKNKDLDIVIEGVSFKKAHFDLYLKYQQARHPDSSMCDTDPNKYKQFIEASYSNSKFICLYLDDQLIGNGVIDQFDRGLSAVYTYFDPEYSYRSLGTFVVLHLIKLALAYNIPYVYLGYWIEQSPKMSYKRHFKPLQGYIERRWVDLEL